MDIIIDNLNNILTVLFTIAIPFVGKYIHKAFKIAKEVSELICAIAEAGQPEQDGSIKFTSEEWAKILKEAKDIKAIFK